MTTYCYSFKGKLNSVYSINIARMKNVNIFQNYIVAFKIMPTIHGIEKK